MDNLYLGRLLHLSDPTLPIGAYIHSNGLETYVQLGLVWDKASTRAYVKNNLFFNLKYNDAAFVKLAYDATEAKDLNRLIELDNECNALKSAQEVRVGSQKLGLRVFKIFSLHIEDELIEAWNQLIQTKQSKNHYAIIYGMMTSLMNIPLKEALYAYFYNAANGIVINAVKLIPLGQLDGQDILFNLIEDIEKLSQEALNIDEDKIGICSVALDIRCMQHERLYSRLYMS